MIDDNDGCCYRDDPPINAGGRAVSAAMIDDANNY